MRQKRSDTIAVLRKRPDVAAIMKKMDRMLKQKASPARIEQAIAKLLSKHVTAQMKIIRKQHVCVPYQ